jgi:hypothetical protein
MKNVGCAEANELGLRMFQGRPETGVSHQMGMSESCSLTISDPERV